MRDLQRLGRTVLAGWIESEQAVRERDVLASMRRTRAFRERHLVSQDIRESGVPVLAFEWCGAEQHLVDQDTESPPVDCAGVPATLDHFWRDVFFSTDEGVCSEICDTALGIDRGHVVRRGIGCNATSV